MLCASRPPRRRRRWCSRSRPAGSPRSRFTTTSSSWPNGSLGELLINGDVWDKLSPQHKEIIKSATLETFIRWYARWQRPKADALHEFLEKHKVQVLKTPPEILTEFLKAWDRIAAREADKDPFFKKVLESQRAYAGVVVPAKRFLFPSYDFAANHYWPEKKAAAATPASTKPAAKP